METTFTALSGISEVRPGDDLAEIILDAAARSGFIPRSGDIFVVAQKIVSKAEGRFVALASVRPGTAARVLAAGTGKDPRLVELILGESTEVVRERPGLIVARHRLGFVLANAGIDQSNVGAEETVLLLPEDPDASAASIRRALEGGTGARLGVIVSDSFGRAWRLGTTGTAIGASGIEALADRRGVADRHGKPLRVTEIGLADEIAAGASLLMGQAAEGRPVVVARGLDWAFGEGRAADLVRPRELDLFG